MIDSEANQAQNTSKQNALSYKDHKKAQECAKQALKVGNKV